MYILPEFNAIGNLFEKQGYVFSRASIKQNVKDIIFNRPIAVISIIFVTVNLAVTKV